MLDLLHALAKPLEEGGDGCHLHHQQGDGGLQQQPADHEPFVDGLAVVADQVGQAEDEGDAEQAVEKLVTLMAELE